MDNKDTINAMTSPSSIDVTDDVTIIIIKKKKIIIAISAFQNGT